MAITDLPALNAALNATSAVFLAAGYLLIRRGDRVNHRRAMLAALATSTLFLVSYLIYHWNVGSKPFPGQGAIRAIYLLILFTHIVLAAVIVPMALVTARRGLTGRFDRHVRLARWTLPLWMYVSVTGVVIYVMLYQLY
jgi:putative membrane protein